MRWTEAELATYQGGVTPLPATGKRPRPQIVASESEIHAAVVDHLRARCRPGVHWHHPATGELRNVITARKLQRMGVRAGLPDLLLLIDGRLHGLELKRERGGRLSPGQRAMHAELSAAGAVIVTAYGIDEALAALSAWGVFDADAPS